MFSGLTNQVSSWMSKKQEDETKSEVAQSESKEDTLESEKTSRYVLNTNEIIAHPYVSV